jgi:polyphosphate kinase
MADLDAPIEVVAAPHLVGTERYLNRELSWLDFNMRVLALAQDRTQPLLERVKFLAIFSQNLDEFFQVRVAGLKLQQLAGIGRASEKDASPAEKLTAIHARVTTLADAAHALLTRDISPALRRAGIVFAGWDDLKKKDKRALVDYFDERLFPVLTPLAVDPAHPFPYISNLSLNLAVVVSDPKDPEPRFARVKVPPSLPRFVALTDGERFLPLEDLIAARLDGLFPGMDVVSAFPFRVTRNADFEVEEDEADDLLEAIELGLRYRKRSPHVVRLEVTDSMSAYVRELLLEELELGEEDVYTHSGRLDHGALWQVYALDRPELKAAPWKPATQSRLAAAIKPDKPLGDEPDPGARSTIFDVLSSSDVLVHHPYDSFITSVGTFVEQAATDPNVLAIKWTLYRTSGPESPIIRNLIRASERGKQVVALVELKARFDEEANIAWARALEEAGVHVVYGLVGLKTHAKIALVVRKEADRLARYTHVGTGNYNPNTATMYEDVGVLSADDDIGADVSELFNVLTGYSQQAMFRKLLVAPLMMRQQLIDLIGRESRKSGRIVMKLNNLLDPQIIDALYHAGESGAAIDLIVRGMCGVRPDVAPNIRVRAMAGRFLEHSRILRFGADPRWADYYIGSPDLMARNLDQRVEVLLPVGDHVSKARLAEILEVGLADDMLAWELRGDGTWEKVAAAKGVDSQQMLQTLATARAQASHRSDADVRTLLPR